ncbi:MAG: ABC transporter permease [Blastocatellia bacterium]
MLSFTLRRLIIIIPMALLVVTLTWGLVRIAPGNFYDNEKNIPAAVRANIKKKYGLDKPWYEQYWTMISNVARGDFGESLKYQGQSVNNIIARHLPYSAIIGVFAYFLALTVGLTAGIVAALRQNSSFDYLSMSVAMLGLSVPNFVLAPILVLIFSFWLYWFPPARWGGISSLILPVVSLAAIYAAYIARLTRAGMLEVMRSDYIRTARAKGLDEKTVLLKHALRGGIVPVVSFTGPALAALLAGTVVVEKIFAVPGLGDIFIKAVGNRDEPLILGIVAFLSILIMLFNLIVDISYGYLDPRIRLE